MASYRVVLCLLIYLGITSATPFSRTQQVNASAVLFPWNSGNSNRKGLKGRHLLDERWLHVEENLQRKWMELETTWMQHKNKFQSEVELLRESLEQNAAQLEQALINQNDQMLAQVESLQVSLNAEKIKLEKGLEFVQSRVETQLFRQRQGIAAFAKSLQNWMGITVGAATTFVASRNPMVAKLSTGIQSVEIVRIVTPAKLPPAIQNTIPFLALGFAMVRAPKEIASSTLVGRWLPSATLSLAIFESTYQVIDRWNKVEAEEGKEVQLAQKVGASTVTALLSGAILHGMLPPWWQMTAAASVAGAKLVLGCVADEVVHNWMRMIRHIGPERLKVRQRLYKRLNRLVEQNVLHPAREALEEMENILSNKTDNNCTTRSRDNSLGRKIKDVVAKSLRLRLTWSIAGAGIAWQCLVPTLMGASRLVRGDKNDR